MTCGLAATPLPRLRNVVRSRIIALASSSIATEVPKLATAASVPARLWNRMSIGAPALERPHLGRHVRQHAVLRRNLPALDQLGGEAQETGDVLDLVDAGVDADQRVAGAVREALVDGGGDALVIVARMVRLEPRAEPARQADRGAGARA